MEEITGSNCDCPEPCSKIAFEPSQSSTIISKQNSETLLGNTTRLKEKFLKARDTQDHVIKNTYVNDLKLVMNISKNYKRLHNYVHRHVIKDSANAKFKQISDVLNFFSTSILQDRNLLSAVSRFIDAYEKSFLSSRQQVWNAIDATVQKIFLIEQYRLNEDDIQSLLPDVINLLDMTQTRLISYDKNMSNDVGNSRVLDLPVSLKDVFQCALNSGSGSGSGYGNSSGSGYGNDNGTGYSNCLSCVEPLLDVFSNLQSAFKQRHFSGTYENSIKTLQDDDKNVRKCLDKFYNKLLSFRWNAYSAINHYYDNLERVLIQANSSIDLDELFSPMRASQLRFVFYSFLNYETLYSTFINSDSPL